jgi:glycosyltransferase involved in cell wall biosynthesis
MTTNEGLSCVIPVYNEETSILEVLTKLKNILGTIKLPWEIIVVDDGSSDKTRELVKGFEDVLVCRHPVNIGYGNAVKSGIRLARYDWIFITDADGTYPISMLPALITYMDEGFEMIIGQRSNIDQVDKPLKRLFRFFFRTIIKQLFGNNIFDPNSGFRVFKKEIAVKFMPFLCGTFSFTTSLTMLSAGMNCFIKYVPINYEVRTGKSKINHFHDTIVTMQYIIQAMTFFNPIKFFILLSLFMILAVCIPAMFFALFNMHTLSLYYMIFGITTALLVAIVILGDIIKITAMKQINKFD